MPLSVISNLSVSLFNLNFNLNLSESEWDDAGDDGQDDHEEQRGAHRELLSSTLGKKFIKKLERNILSSWQFRLSPPPKKKKIGQKNDLFWKFF